jgi:hypothetical protein
MIVIFGFSIPTLAPIVIAIGLGTLALGIVPIIIYWKKGAAYFTRRPLELPDELDAKAPENIDVRRPAA